MKPIGCYFTKHWERRVSGRGWRVHAWVLMSNHYHLMVETPEANLVAGMRWLQNTYTRRHNCRHRLWGRLFGDRYKAILSEGGSGYYYCSLMDYIHLNPVRAGLVRVKRGESVRDYVWSSVAKGYAVPPRRRPIWLAAEEGLAMAQCADTAAGRRRFVEHLDSRAREEGVRAGMIEPGEDRRHSHLRHGWYWGSQAFAERMLQLARRELPRGKIAPIAAHRFSDLTTRGRRSDFWMVAWQQRGCRLKNSIPCPAPTCERWLWQICS